MTKYKYNSEVYDTIEEAVEEALSFVDDEIIINLWNEYCYDIRDYDNQIHSMDEFDDYCCNITPTDIVCNLTAEFNTHDEYFIDGIYGFKSFDYPQDVVVFSDLACWLADRLDYYDEKEFSEIEEIDDTDNN